jgi:hypothetical protein
MRLRERSSPPMGEVFGEKPRPERPDAPPPRRISILPKRVVACEGDGQEPRPNPDPTLTSSAPTLTCATSAIPWRPRPAELARWPIPWRERWGLRANELQDAGHPWEAAERQAFAEVEAAMEGGPVPVEVPPDPAVASRPHVERGRSPTGGAR